MTESSRPDGNSGQVAESNVDLRHLTVEGVSTLSPVVVCSTSDKISYAKDLRGFQDEGLATGDTAPVKVPRADSDKSPSQDDPGVPIKWASNSHLSIRVSDTAQLWVKDANRGIINALVDAQDEKRLGEYSWYLITTKQGKRYVAAHVPGGLTYLHREVLGLVSTAQVDHKNGDTLDCRRSNLRVATPGQNRANSRKRADKTYSSKYKGVTRRKGRWQAAVRDTYLGLFPTELEAARAYDRAARAEFGEFARLNFPEVA